MIVTPFVDFCRDDSSLVAPVGAHHQNLMFTDNMWTNSHGNFHTNESTSMPPVAAQDQMSYNDNMVATSHDSTVLTMATQNQMPQRTMIVTPHDSRMLPDTTHNQVSQDNMINIVTPHDSMMLPGTNHQDQESQDNMMVTPSDNMLLADNYDDLFLKSGLFEKSEEPTQLNQIVDENTMLPPQNDFYTCGDDQFNGNNSSVEPLQPAPCGGAPWGIN